MNQVLIVDKRLDPTSSLRSEGQRVHLPACVEHPPALDWVCRGILDQQYGARELAVMEAQDKQRIYLG